ncbi:MAG: transglutaminase family protein, partial [Chloroflexia bacterium]|nr:transglutaminase family protein [Chloroflexia bacterium]
MPFVVWSRRSQTMVRLGLCLVLLITALVPVPARANAESARATVARELVQAALSAQATNEPAALSAPLSIARTQSAVTLDEAEDGLVTLSFSVTNTLPPLIAPPVVPGATYTESIRLVADFDRAADPNTAHSVLLTTALPTGVQFVRAVPAPERSGSALAWALADLPPQATLSVTLTVRAAGSAGPLTDEAQAWAMLHGRPVQASSAPVGLVADDLAPWLQRTPDADHLDPFIVAQAAALGHDSTRIVAFVNGLGFEPYLGSLRGARGTLWSAAGNSLDRTSLLIALLRASGVPARYRHGSLADERARELLASMFPPALGTIGFIPADTPVSNPAEDELLLSETRDHWWVEAFVPGQGWRDLDPAFSTTPGQTFVATVAADGSDRVAEPSAAQRHTVALRLRVEQHNVLSNALQGGLASSYPLSVTLNSFSLVGEPVNLEHLVNQRTQGGMVFANQITDYTPSFIIGDEAIIGQNYQDFVTNFPLATRITMGVWLEIVTRGPDGSSERHERVLADRAGFVARRGGATQLPEIGQTPLISEDQVYSLLIAPSTVPLEAVNRAAVGSDAIVRESQAGYTLIESLQGASQQQLTERLPELRAAQLNVQTGVRLSQELLLLQFAAESDFATARLGEQLRVRPVLTTPRVLIASWETRDDVAELRLDLRSNARRTIVYPGQSWEGLIAFNLARGLLDGELESDVLARLSGRPVVSVANILRQAQAEGIPLTRISASSLDLLER